MLCSSVVALRAGGSRRSSIGNETCDVACRKKCLCGCSRIVGCMNDILLWGCRVARPTISRGLVTRLELEVVVVCSVVVFGLNDCRGHPRRMVVGIEVGMWCMCCCLFDLTVVVVTAVLLVVVRCLCL